MFWLFGIRTLMDMVPVAPIVSLHHTQGGKLYEKIKPDFGPFVVYTCHAIYKIKIRFLGHICLKCSDYSGDVDRKHRKRGCTTCTKG